jgi:methyl-accepting chemotaxis protein
VRIAASPVLDADGKRVGTVVEWADRTQEVAVEQEVASIVAKALDGDLTERLATAGKSGFFEKLATGLNQLLENTGQMVRQIKVAASAVHRGADEISQGNANLSQRTEEQSSSLEETASSMEEMTSTVKQNADNAGQANQLATAARDQAEKGGAVVGKAVRAMTDINEASKKIADIIGVIDEIAFQTNLLALNAAVEAARAGEQGRGFAVVATEVRSLAGRSATAAKEIKDLIQDSVRKVEDGSALVTQSGQTLEQIVASVKKVSDIIAEIAAASREQSSGIEQVNKAIMQMDEMTQQNAALVEQATAASQSMAEQASELNGLMERYRLGGGEQAAAAAPDRAERRGAERPWSDRGAKHAKPAEPQAARNAAAPPRPKSANGGDAEWQDF